MSQGDADILSQESRTMKFTTSPDMHLHFERMSAQEGISEAFKYDVELLSDDHNIDIVPLLGNSATVHMKLATGKWRYFNGLISEFSFSGTQDRHAVYKATVRPWMWFLTRTSDCKIFQNKSVPDIIKEVFRSFEFSDFKDELNDSYRKWEYCVQYRESAFDFVSRLLEQEGIYYYFEHEEDKHTLVLADSLAAHSVIPDYEEIPYFPPDEGALREDDHISQWSVSRSVQSGRVALNDFNFEKPKVSLKVQSSIVRSHEHSDYEVYDYPGEYSTENEGNAYVRRRIEELQAKHECAQGSGNVANLAVGSIFTLTDYPRDDQNREYLVISTNYQLVNNAYVSGSHGAAAGHSECHCSFTVVDSSVQFRAPQVTPKPIVQGPQTALVVGQGEIHTNNYACVKVQFHWDRYGKSDENSSCWVRVSQNWAGKDWGSMSLPHVGHEVIVEHLEGDPDRPIITGRVYNDANMPPASLPDKKTQTTWHCHGGNSLTMEGGIDIQSVSLFSPTFNTQVTMGELTLVNDNSITIGGYTCCTDGNHTEITKGDRDIRTKGKEFWRVDGCHHKHIKGWVSSSVLGFKTSFIGGAKTEVLVGAETKINKSVKTEIIRGRVFKNEKHQAYKITDDDLKQKASDVWQKLKNIKRIVKNDENIEIGGNQILKIGDDYSLEAKTTKIVAKKIEQKGETVYLSSTELLSMVSDLNKIRCKVSDTKADKIKLNGKTSINNNTMEILP